jgi:two-component system sensor histidine kinase RpfC
VSTGTIAIPRRRLAGRNPVSQANLNAGDGRAKPEMTSATEAKDSAGSGLTGRLQRLTAIIVTLYAVGVPLLLSLVELVRADSQPVVTAWLAILIAGPALAAAVVALQGTGAIARGIVEKSRNSEAQQIVIHLFFPGVILVYLAALAGLRIEQDVLTKLFAVTIAGTLVSWLLFVHLMLKPEPSRIRRAAAILSDTIFVSLFLHLGGQIAVPWFAVYLWIVFGFGFRFGARALVGSAALSFVGFAMVLLTTPFWRERPWFAAGIFLALVLLPAYALDLIRRLTVAKAQA